MEEKEKDAFGRETPGGLDEHQEQMPVQELPADIPAEVREKLARDLNDKEAAEDLKQDVRDAEKEEAREAPPAPNKLTKSRLLKLLVKKQYVKLREVTEDMQPADLAELLEELDENNRLVVFRLLKKEVATEVFTYMSDEARDELVDEFTDIELITAIEEMSLDDAADLLEDMPAGVVKRVLEKSSPQTRESLNKLLHYPENSAGSLMTLEYVRLRKEMDVKQAFAAIRQQGEQAETLYTCYVVEKNRLLGIVSVRSLLLADLDTPITEIMDENVIAVRVTDDQEFVSREMQRYDFTAMPVLDNEGMFVGIITIDDAIDVLTEESTEDMQKMAAILPDDEATTYFGTSVWTHAKQRIPWLMILMLSATFTGMVTTHYEQAFVAGLLHAHADGHRRQLRQPGQHPDGARAGAGRDRAGRLFEGGLQGAAGLDDRGSGAGRGQRPAHLADVRRFWRRAVPQRHGLRRGGQPGPLPQHHSGQAGGRPAAPRGQKAGLRPRHHGQPLPLHHCGLLQSADLLPDRNGGLPRLYVKQETSGSPMLKSMRKPLLFSTF